MNSEVMKMDESCEACKRCTWGNKEHSCEVKCKVCGKIFGYCYIVDGMCINCKNKYLKERYG